MAAIAGFEMFLNYYGGAFTDVTYNNLSLGNFGTLPPTIYHGILDAGYSAFFILSLVVLYRRLLRLIPEMDSHNLTSADYSIMVSEMPINFTDASAYLEHFQQFGEVAEVSVALDNVQIIGYSSGPLLKLGQLMCDFVVSTRSARLWPKNWRARWYVTRWFRNSQCLTSHRVARFAASARAARAATRCSRCSRSCRLSSARSCSKSRRSRTMPPQPLFRFSSPSLARRLWMHTVAVTLVTCCAAVAASRVRSTCY